MIINIGIVILSKSIKNNNKLVVVKISIHNHSIKKKRPKNKTLLTFSVFSVKTITIGKINVVNNKNNRLNPSRAKLLQIV
jgi:hypothetical protein